MSDDLSIRVDGVSHIIAALEKLPARLESKVLRQAARAVAKEIVPTAKANAPKDTGAIRRTIKVRAVKGKRGSIAVRVRTGTREELAKFHPKRAEEILTSKWYYPAAVEYGYSRNGVTAPPNAYMRRALRSHAESGKRAMRRALLQGLKRESAILAAKQRRGGG